MPDGYNCGIAVISRAESFMNPSRVLNVPANTPATAQKELFDNLRRTYLEAFQKRISRVQSDETLKGQMGLSSTPVPSTARKSTPLPVKRLQINTQDEERPRKAIKPTKASFLVRNTATPKPKAIVLQESLQWHDCIRACAKAKNLDGEGLVEAVQHAPSGQPLSMVLRVLQLMCEVANEDLLFRLRATLLAGKGDVPVTSCRDPSCVTLANHFRRVHDYVIAHPHYSTFLAWLAQMYYYEEFQQVCRDASDMMDKAKREREKAKRYKKRGLDLDCRANFALGHLGEHSGTAEDRVKAEVCRILGGKEKYWKPLGDYIRQGDILHGLLSFDGGDRSNPYWLFLLPLYEGSRHVDPLAIPRPPVLDVLEYDAPEVYDKLRKPITSAE